MTDSFAETESAFGLVLVAAGSGSRLGSDLPKALVLLQGKPLFLRALEAVMLHPGLKEIALVVPASHQSDFQGLTAQLPLTVPLHVVTGGDTRTKSVIQGIRAISPTLPILVHDAARCLASLSLIKALNQALAGQSNFCVIPVLPIQDALKKMEGTRVVSAPSRDDLFATQTPQGLSPDLAQKLAGDTTSDFHDEASWALHHGANVVGIEGERWNLKITYPEDLDLASFWLKRLDK